MVQAGGGNRPRAPCALSLMEDRVYDVATTVDAEDGKVVLDGPDGVAVLMTPEAALETSDRLLLGATQARGQQIQEEQRRRARESAAEKDPPAP